MQNVYDLNFCAPCPVNGEKINYSITLTVTDGMIPVEDIQIALSEMVSPIMQEDLWTALKTRFAPQGALVDIVGTHSNVKITSTG